LSITHICNYDKWIRKNKKYQQFNSPANLRSVRSFEISVHELLLVYPIVIFSRLLDTTYIRLLTNKHTGTECQVPFNLSTPLQDDTTYCTTVSSLEQLNTSTVDALYHNHTNANDTIPCSSEICQNGGSCYDVFGTFWCVCHPRFDGLQCEYTKTPGIVNVSPFQTSADDCCIVSVILWKPLILKCKKFLFSMHRHRAVLACEKNDRSSKAS
jgi:hypothetical protein